MESSATEFQGTTAAGGESPPAAAQDKAAAPPAAPQVASCPSAAELLSMLSELHQSICEAKRCLLLGGTPASPLLVALPALPGLAQCASALRAILLQCVKHGAGGGRFVLIMLCAVQGRGPAMTRGMRTPAGWVTGTWSRWLKPVRAATRRRACRRRDWVGQTRPHAPRSVRYRVAAPSPRSFRSTGPQKCASVSRAAAPPLYLCKVVLAGRQVPRGWRPERTVCVLQAVGRNADGVGAAASSNRDGGPEADQLASQQARAPLPPRPGGSGGSVPQLGRVAAAPTPEGAMHLPPHALPPPGRRSSPGGQQMLSFPSIPEEPAVMLTPPLQSLSGAAVTNHSNSMSVDLDASAAPWPPLPHEGPTRMQAISPDVMQQLHQLWQKRMAPAAPAATLAVPPGALTRLAAVAVSAEVLEVLQGMREDPVSRSCANALLRAYAHGELAATLPRAEALLVIMQQYAPLPIRASPTTTPYIPRTHTLAHGGPIPGACARLLHTQLYVCLAP